MNWYENTRRTYLLDFQLADGDQMPVGQPRNLRDIDVKKIVLQLKEAAVDAVYVHAKDNQGNCYFNTKYGHKSTVIGDKDLMEEFVRYAHEEGIKVLFYVQLPRERRGSASGFGLMPKDDGVPLTRNKQFTGRSLSPSLEEAQVICLNGPGREYTRNILIELASHYDMDGFWLDGLGWATAPEICYCPACKAKYYEDTGRQLPADIHESPESFACYMSWRVRQMGLMMQEFETIVKKIRPEISVTHNNTAADFNVDGRFWELDAYLCEEFHAEYGIGALATQCRKLAAYKPGKVFEIEIWRFNCVPAVEVLREYQVRTPVQLDTEMAMVFANGGMVQYYDQINPDGTLDLASVRSLKPAFETAKKYEPFLLHKQTKRVADVSVLYSLKTINFSNPDRREQYMKELNGISLACTEAHIQYDFITDEALTNGALPTGKVLILPNVYCLSQAENQAIEAFVKNGGKLISTYRTGMYNATGFAQDNFSLADVFGADYLETFNYRYGYCQFDQEAAVAAGLPMQWPIPLMNTLQLKVAAKVGAQSVGNMVEPMLGNHMGFPPQTKTIYPACVINPYGASESIYFPFPLGTAYQVAGHPDTLQQIVSAIRYALGDSLSVNIKAPKSFESVLYTNEDGSEYSLHLVNLTQAGMIAAPGRIFSDVLPVYNVEVELEKAFSKAVLQPEGIALEVQHTAEGKTFVTIPKIDIYSIVQFS